MLDDVSGEERTPSGSSVAGTAAARGVGVGGSEGGNSLSGARFRERSPRLCGMSWAGAERQRQTAPNGERMFTGYLTFFLAGDEACTRGPVGRACATGARKRAGSRCDRGHGRTMVRSRADAPWPASVARTARQRAARCGCHRRGDAADRRWCCDPGLLLRRTIRCRRPDDRRPRRRLGGRYRFDGSSGSRDDDVHVAGYRRNNKESSCP